MIRRIVIILVILIAWISVNAQQQPKLDRYERKLLLFGFLYSQDTILNWIKDNRPDLKLRAIDAQQSFNRMYSHAIGYVPFNIDSANANKSLRIISDTVIIFLRDTSNHRKFIDIVGDRAKGRIQSPVKETLLYYEYLGEPEREVNDGFFNTYAMYINDHTELIYGIPMSWGESSLASEKHYGLMKCYRSEFGYGDELIYISSRIMDADTTDYRKKLFQKMAYSKKMAKSIISGNECAELIYHENDKIGNLPGQRYKHKKCETIGEQFQYALGISYSWAYQDNIFLVTYSVINPNSDVFLNNHYDRYKRLFTNLSADLRVRIK